MKRYINNYRDTVPLSNVSVGYRPNLTKLATTQGKITLSCDLCDMEYETYACWAKRVTNHYCSRACAGEAKRIEVPTNCVVCDKDMISTPSNLTKIRTCSYECFRLKKMSKIKSKKGYYNSLEYKQITKDFLKVSVCSKCEITHGPWVVQGIKTGLKENGLPFADGSDAKLVCKHCHLDGYASIASQAAQVKRLEARLNV